MATLPQSHPSCGGTYGYRVVLEGSRANAAQMGGALYNLKRWTVMPSGGHFAPMEEPERLVEDIRTFYRSLRG